MNNYEIKSRLLMEAMDEVGVCSPTQAATIWANGLKTRNAASQYSVMTKELKDEYAWQLDKSFPNWVTGVSSPWVESFDIIKSERTKANRYLFQLLFHTKTAAGPAGDYKAMLTVVRKRDFWQIEKISTDKELNVYTGFL